MLQLLPESGLYRPNSKSNLYSLLIHFGVVALLFALASSKPALDLVNKPVFITAPILAPLLTQSHAGGGGGDRSPLPAGKGVLPPRSDRQFVPPEQVLHNLNPKLSMQPTIIAPPDAGASQVDPSHYGDPLSRLGILSNGPGSGGGIGSGNHGGIGSGEGPGAGTGPGCCGVSGAFTSGLDGVSAPQLIFQVEPQYSEEARKAKLSGIVVLDLIVDPSGRARNIRVVSGAGMGLDERAVQAVEQWRFKPGMKSGKAVPVRARVEVNFRLL
jgi:TonB family protein